MLDFKAKMHLNRFWLGLEHCKLPQLPLGSLQCSPGPLAGIKGTLLLREGRSAGKGKGKREGKERGYEWREGKLNHDLLVENLWFYFTQYWLTTTLLSIPTSSINTLTSWTSWTSPELRPASMRPPLVHPNLTGSSLSHYIASEIWNDVQKSRYADEQHCLSPMSAVLIVRPRHNQRSSVIRSARLS